MTRDEQFTIENAAASENLDLLLATHRCVDCGADAVIEEHDEWLCFDCVEELERASAALDFERRAA